MARTISRTRLMRGTQPTRTRVVVAGDAVAPQRRRLSANGLTRPNRPSDPGERRNRPPMQRKSGAHTGTKTRTRSRTEEVAAPPSRVRTRSCATEAVELARQSLAAGRAKKKVRRSLVGGDAARERDKLASLRDGRYARKGARFIV